MKRSSSFSSSLPSYGTSFWAFVVTAACLALAACTGANNSLGGGNQVCVTTPCGNGSTYQTCTSQPAAGSTCANVTYAVGGQSFSCNTCQGDCSTAANQASMACLGTEQDGGGGVDAGGNQTCSASTSCGTGGRTYKECTTTATDGACVAIDYETSDGHTFTCAGCTNCGPVAQNLASYCANPDVDGGGGSTSCSSPVSCGTGGLTYKECTTTGAGGACESIKYELSNGKSYTCSSCTNCTAAVSSLQSACTNTASTTTCTSWSTCSGSTLQYEECTTSLGGSCESIYYETSDGQTFDCNSCSSCSSAVSNMESYCASQSQPTTTCSTQSACGSTGVTYQLCTTTQAGTCTGEYYTTSDSHTYTCSGCNCSSAGSSLSAYCATLTTGNVCTPACTSGNLCCNCSGTLECLSSNSGTYTCASYSCQ